MDFTYEVSRSLAACEGALLIVDAAQGVEAQTMANFYLALENDLAIISVINKIDLPSAEQERIRRQLEDVLGLEGEDAILTSAKQGIGTQEVLEAIVKHVPPPSGSVDEPLKALVFDSFFDSYQGVVVYIRLMEGEIHAGMKIKLMFNNRVYEVQRVGVFAPKMFPVDELSAGDVGYFTASIKNIHDVQVGDTVTGNAHPADKPLAGFKKVKPMVFAGLYPTDSSQYEPLRGALERLSLNDTSFSYEPENSHALGFGFRCGFLGLLHMEIIQERLEREFNLSLIVTAPTVVYQITKKKGEIVFLDNPTHLPSPQEVERIEEPIVDATVIVPAEFFGGVLALLQDKRGEQKSFEYLDDKTVLIKYRLPLNEIITDFYDRLKSCSKGYASFDYDLAGFAESSLVKLDILVNTQVVDALSTIVHKDKAYYYGRRLAERLKEIIPRQLFEVIIQCSIGNKVLARETVRPLRKDVIAKCYGGDITRKRKLLEKQKQGKRRMKQLGNVEIPQEAFMAVLKMD